MAKPAARLGDDVAHKKAAGAILSGSGNVLVNGLPAARQSDPVQHDDEVESIVQGSGSVSFNSLPASRITDMVGCGGKIAAGSGNVLIGDGGAVACSACPGGVTKGNPVNPLLGAKVLGDASELDFALPGPLALVWQRHYSSYVGPAGADSGILGQGWRLPFEMHLKFASDKTELFDTKNRVITFGPLAPGEQEHSRSEGFWLLRGGRPAARTTPPPALPEGVKLEDLHPAARALYTHEAWQDEARWSHIPAQWRENPACCLATTADRNVWLFHCLDDTPTPTSPWLLVALFDVFGRMQRFERATSSEARNLPQGLVNPKRPRANEPELPLGQLTAIVDGLGRRFGLHYIHKTLLPTDTVPGDTGLRLQAVTVQDTSSPALQQALNGKPLVRYHYSAAGDLIKVEDRHGRAVREFTYEANTAHAPTQHRMTSHRVLGGPVASYSYEAQPAPGKAYCRVVWQRNEGGLDYHFDYQADQTVVTDSLGRKTTYAFKGEGGKQRLSQLTDAMGGVTQYEHNLYGQLMQEVDPLGRMTQYRRDAQGRLTGLVLPDRSQTKSEWHDTLNTLSSVQGPDGLTTTFVHDQYGRLLESKVEGDTTQHRYAEPGSSEQARLTADFPQQIIDAKGGLKTLHWSTCGQLLRYTDCSKQSTEYLYDVWGDLAQITNALGETASYHRNALGQLTTITYPDKTQVHYHHDERGLVSHVVDVAGQSSTYERDRHGRVLATIQANRSIRFQYDAAARLTQLTNENGAHTRFAYDALDRLIEEVGFDGRRQCYQYDAAGQLTASSDQGPQPGSHQSAGQLSDPLITRYGYDPAGRLVKREIPAVVQHSVQNQQASTPPQPQTIFPEQTHHFTYDKAGRLLETWCNKTSVQFKRDVLGRLAEEKLVHEDTNPYTAPIAAQHAAQFTHQLTHTYDALGVREASRLPHVGQISYLHYGSGHLHQVAHNKTALVDFERDALHRETLRSLSSLSSQPGAASTAPGSVRHEPVEGFNPHEDTSITLHRSFDPMGRLLRMSSHSVAEVMGRARAHSINTIEPLVGGTPAPTITALSRDYTYDPVGQLIAIGQNTHQFAGLNAPPPKTTRYQYDAAHRLVAAQYTDGQIQTWQFDPAGNRLPEAPPAAPATAYYSPSGNGTNGDSWLTRAALATPPAAQHRYWADNRIHQATSEVNGQKQNQTIEYDAWGNIRRMHTTSGPNKGQTLDLLYDGLHQLRASQLFEPDAVVPGASTMANPLQGDQQGAGKTTTTFYDYDPLGRRISKTVVDQTPGRTRKITTRTWFGWDGDRLVTTETNTATERKAISTVYEPQSFVPLLRFEIDVSGKSKAIPAKPEVLHYHCNHIGTPEALIDRRGQIVWQAEFDPWGNLRDEYNPFQIRQPIRMQGQQLDAETGLFYNRFRYYQSTTGRYATQDPIGLRGGNNKYGYVGGVPTLLIDPLGLWASQMGFYVHQQVGQYVFGRELTFSQNGMVMKGHEWADSKQNQTSDKSFMHAMRDGDKGQSPANACAQANAFIKKVGKMAIDEKNNGNADKAAFLFGVALHTIQDATSPAHAGFQAWSNNESMPSQILHGLSESMDPGQYSPLWKETKKAWDAYKAGDVNGFSIKCPCAP